MQPRLKLLSLMAIALLVLGLGGWAVANANKPQSVTQSPQPVVQSSASPATQPSPQSVVERPAPSPVQPSSSASLPTVVPAKSETVATKPALPNAATIFDPLLPQLKQSPVPLKLPTYIPVRGQTQPSSGAKPLTVYATLNQPQTSGYSIVLGYSKDCAGGNACRLGTVSGQVKPQQSIEQVYAFARDPQFKGRKSKEPMAKVTLANGQQGWFIPWTCGANCSDAQVIWDDGLHRYSVGIKVGDKASLVKMANSAIEVNR